MFSKTKEQILQQQASQHFQFYDNMSFEPYFNIKSQKASSLSCTQGLSNLFGAKTVLDSEKALFYDFCIF